MNPAGDRKYSIGSRRGLILSGSCLALVLSACCLLPAAHCAAKPTQEDFFKGMKEEVSENSDPSGKVLISGILGSAAVVMLLSLISLRRKRQVKPKAVNHAGKLLKEITKRVPLRPVEIRQLRVLAESQSAKGNPIENPLVMVLCPSLLAKSLKQPPAKIDRKAITGLARKLGMHVTKAKK